MKLFAQCGYGPGDKIIEGTEHKIIDGLIFGCKDIVSEKIKEYRTQLFNLNPKIEIFLDPQFYTTLYANDPNFKEGKLSEWSFFKSYRRSSLEVPGTLDNALKTVFSDILELPVTSVISPNIFISRSFDSIEALISKNFIRRSRPIIEKEFKNKKEIFCTLAFCRDALLNQREFEEFINDLTVIENPPDGFYILLGTSRSGEINELFDSNIISNWMLLNFTLSINGFKVINGYSDIFSPILGITGAYGGATGWWSNLQTFSIERFVPDRSGGRLPIVKYLSNKLFKRIPHYELNAYHEIVGDKILNGYLLDSVYLMNEPDRKNEIYQTWETLKNLSVSIIEPDDLNKSLQNIQEKFNMGISLIDHINHLSGLSRIPVDHIEILKESIEMFKRKAEI